MKLSVPYLKLRDGRPRWEPGPRLRAKGWKGRDLKDEAGRWLGQEAAIAAARALNDEVEAWRAGGGRRRREPAPRRSERSCEALWERYAASADYKMLAESTRRDYAKKARVFLDAGFAEAPVAAVTKPAMVGLWQQLYDTRGHAMANGVVAVARAMLSFAELVGWRPAESNPAFNLGRPSLAPRVAFWEAAKLEAIVATADRLGVPSIGDAIVVALHTAQRQGDVLAMPARIFADRVRLTQFKTGALIDAPATPQLVERVAAIRRRHAAGIVVELRPADTLIVSEATGRQYRPDHFRHEFARVRAAAVQAFPELEVARRFAPKLSDLRFQDLRDTAVTRLALAGCTLPEIAAITGHSPAHITSVIRHYLALNEALADRAIEKLNAWISKERISI